MTPNATDPTESKPRENCDICHRSHVGLSPNDIRNLHTASVNWYDDSGTNGVLNNVEHSRYRHGGGSFPSSEAHETYLREHPPEAYDLAVETLGTFVREYSFDKYHEIYLEKFENGALVHYVPTGWVYYYPKSQMDAAFDFARARGTRSTALNRMFGD